FFKSVTSDDPQPEDSTISPAPNPTPTPTSDWSFSGIIKTLASKSETYRRDLEELTSGLKKETAVIRQAASRAVKDLPSSLEVGATVAQESLESVGQAFDDISSSVWKSTATIISRGKKESYDNNSNSYANNHNNNDNNERLSKRYSRFEMQLRALQCDASTYCVEPEDEEEYEKWRLGFVFDEREKDIEDLLRENGVIGDIYKEVLPGRVADAVTFWTRYFYRVHKLKEAEDARVKLVKRAILGQEEEDLSWDFDDGGGEEEENNGSLLRQVPRDGVERNDDDDDGKVVEEGKEGIGDTSCKDSDISIVSSQPSMAEEADVGWDEIEDTGSNDESKAEAFGSSRRADLRKRLTAADEEEDLSWDIEDDDDEPVKP
ncbi:BSD domain-containing protein, partial [Cephalotus follicularis]